MRVALSALLGLFVLILAPAVHAGPASPAGHASVACADLVEAECSAHAGASRVGLHVQHGAGCHAASGICAVALVPAQEALPAGAARTALASPSAAVFWSDRARDPMLRPPIRRA
jgi:hypothetical protein